MSTMKPDDVHCATLTHLSEIAGTFISQNNSSNGEKSKDLKYILQECVDTFSNYRDECKKIKKLGLFANPESVSRLEPKERIKIFKIYETAYTYYKIIHITILTRIPKLPTFIQIRNEKDIPNARQKKNQEVIGIYNTLVTTLIGDENISKIKTFIKNNSSESGSPTDDIHTKSSTTKVFQKFDNGSSISPGQLQVILKQFSSSTLLIDIRPRLEYNKCRIHSDKIMCIEPVSFKESYTDADVEKKSLITSSSDEVDLFKSRDQYEYIVLYSGNLDQSGSDNEKLVILMNLLLNRSFDKPLNHTRVLILNGGIEAWATSGGRTDTLSSLVEGKRQSEGTDDDIYIKGNTSRLNLQAYPKNIPSLHNQATSASMQTMMGTSPHVENNGYSLYDQQTKINQDVKRASSFKKLFSTFRNSSGSSVNSNTGASLTNAPPLNISTGLSPQLYSASTSSLSYASPDLPKSNDSRTINYPDASTLLGNNNSNANMSSSPLTKTYQGSTSSHRDVPLYNSGPVLTSHTRSQSYGENGSIKPIPLQNDYSGNSAKSRSPSKLPEIPRLPARPTSSSFSNGSNSRPHPMMSLDSRNTFSQPSSYQKGLDLDFMTGLENMGNSCYMNCIIQCILGTHELTKIFLNDSYEKHINLNSKLGSKGVLAKNFARLVHSMYDTGILVTSSSSSKKKSKHAVRPAQFKFACGSINSLFKDMSQQDCQEFCQFLLDGLHEDLNQCGGNPPLKELSKQAEDLRERLSFRIASSIEWERYLTTDFSVIVDLFQGQYASRLQCKVCEHTSTTYQPFSVLSVPMPSKKNGNLMDCFTEFTKCENLEIDEQWSCPHCKKKQPSTKQLTITRLPRNLIIHLKRFDNRMNKNGSFVNYPFTLDLTKFWPDDFDGNLPPGVTDELPSRGQIPPFNYRLYGVACHFGSLYGGHYTAYVDKGVKNGWYYFDDTIYRPIKNHNEPITASAYVLFYHRVYGI
ncbi:ubiquitin-specific protease [Maudiozyma humilis]|uniref:Ubiquitin carboxyl-terminal hydrolase n=1 Tax=Maudiozyma humilis TaxID=51915 RepID=A0AAV5RV97_MAUHU|nr:ubiquitin-specific protease [Kazachstania humilis]